MATLTHSTVEVHSGLALRPPQGADAAAWSSYFEELYRDAAGEAARVPWADLRPNPAMTAWLNREAPGLIRPGASVVVVGCGLGDDVRDLCERGYEAVGFDVSPTAIAWARRRHPSLAEHFTVADLFSPPPGMLRRADLVIEVNTIQSLHPSMRARAADAICTLARPRGTIVAVCRGRSDEESLPETPPFPLTARELLSLFAPSGWRPMRDLDDFMDAEDPPTRRLRAVLRRS